MRNTSISTSFATSSRMENTDQIELARGHTPYSRPCMQFSLSRPFSEPSKAPTPVLPLLTTKRVFAPSSQNYSSSWLNPRLRNLFLNKESKYGTAMVVVSFWTAWSCLTVRKEILGLYMAFNGGILGRNTKMQTQTTRGKALTKLRTSSTS
jgi:hypothetical protein